MWQASSWGASMAEKAQGLALQIIPGVCDINARSVCDVAYHWYNFLGFFGPGNAGRWQGK